MDVGVIGGDGMCDVLHHHRLAALWAGDEQTALSFADRGDDVDDAAGDVLFAAHVAFEPDVLIGMERRQVLEHDLVF